MELRLLVDRVGRHLAAGSRHPEQAGAAMRRLIVSAALAAEVRSTVSGSDAVERLSAASQVHPNAFDKIPLLHTGSGPKLVLHRWSTSGDSGGESIHDHRWDFCSAVLSGALHCEEYVERADGPVRTHAYEYRSPGSADTYPLAFRGDSRVALVRTVTHRAGSVYYQPRDVLHRARASEGSTVTLVLQGPVLVDRTTVHRPPPSPSPSPDSQREVLRMSPETVREALAGLLEALPSPRGD